jgi:DNA-directed RNA polymerase specialized sigma24 family protein
MTESSPSYQKRVHDPIREVTEQELEGLPRDQRAALAAHVLGKMNYEAAAAYLQIPIGTVKSRINRARSKIIRMRAKAAE